MAMSWNPLSRKFLPVVLGVVAPLVAADTCADIYKCPLPDGTVRFSDVICADGRAEPVVLLENSPLDSTAERENIARYQQQARHTSRQSRRSAPQVVLLRDTATEERNARITAQGKKQKKQKAGKRRKGASTKKKNSNS